MTKSITFTIMHFIIALSVAYVLTGSLVIGGLIAVVEPLVNSVGYYFHEKVWDSIKAKRAQSQGVHSPAPATDPAPGMALAA